MSTTTTYITRQCLGIGSGYTSVSCSCWVLCFDSLLCRNTSNGLDHIATRRAIQPPCCQPHSHSSWSGLPFGPQRGRRCFVFSCCVAIAFLLCFTLHYNADDAAAAAAVCYCWGRRLILTEKI